ELAPPTAVVEWISSLPIEIEMVVHSPVDTPGTGVTHEWLPWLTKSPVYCRLTRVHSDTQVFVSGCFGDLHDSDTRQVAHVFQTLQDRLAEAGSDLQHMAKATYYVTNEAASQSVNEIRPMLYDSEHPPAASKAMVSGVGMPQLTVTLDMIAVPATE
ncbi:MAG: RidA family protein, partial [Pirellulales bacterium]